MTASEQQWHDAYQAERLDDDFYLRIDGQALETLRAMVDAE